MIPVMGPVMGAPTIGALDPFVASIDPDAEAFAGAVRANGGSISSARLTVINQFIAAEKAAGTWALTDDYWGLWAENSVQALTSLKQRRLATVSGAPVFTADRDYAGDGADDFIDTGFILSTHGVNLTGTNQRIAAYERTNVNSSNTAAGAAANTSARATIIPRNGTVLSGGLNNSSGTISHTLSPEDSRGLKAISRAGGGLTVKGYDRGVALTDSTVAAVGTALPARSLYLLALNNAGTAANFRACSLGFVCLGAPLSGIQEVAQYNNVQAWATAVGANV